MKRLVRRAAVMGVVVALAYGIGACNEEGNKETGAFRTPPEEQARPTPDPGARPDPAGTTDPKESSPLAPETDDPRSQGGTGGSGADAPASTGPGTSLSRQDGGVDPGARGMAGSGSLGPADGGTPDAGTPAKR
jgi:hypothetical protein